MFDERDIPITTSVVLTGVSVVPYRGEWRLQSPGSPRGGRRRVAVVATDGNTNMQLDTVEPEPFTKGEMVNLIARSVGRNAKIVDVLPRVALLASKMARLLL